MDKESSNNRDYHLHLISIYIYNRFLNNLSLRERAEYDMGYIRIYLHTYDEELDKLSDEELERKIKSIKEPWWSFLYKKIEGKDKALFVVYTLLIDRDYRWDTLKILYKYLKMKPK